jgi:hypothetical protein
MMSNIRVAVQTSSSDRPYLSMASQKLEDFLSLGAM